MDDLALDKQLCFALYSSANKVSRLYRALLEPFGLTFPQYLALVALWQHAPCPVGVLCHVLELESSTVTPLLKRLETLGYVTRTRDRMDERRVEVGLTEQGMAFRTQASAIRSRLVDMLGMAKDDIGTLRVSLQKLGSRIDHCMSGLARGSLPCMTNVSSPTGPGRT